MRRCFVLLAAVVGLLACSANASASPRLYAPLYFHEPQAVAGYERQADGTLTPLAGSPFGIATEPPSGIGGLAFAPDGRRAAAGFYFEGGAVGLTVAGDGTVSAAQAPILTTQVHAVAVSPDGRFAYTASVNPKAEGIFGYALGPDGALTPLTGGPFGKGLFWDMAMSADGRFLYAAAPLENTVQRYAINADGSLSFLGATPVPAPFTLVDSPDGRFLFVGIGNGSAAGVASLAIGPDGSLTEKGEPVLTGDPDMDYFAVSPDGGHIYMPADNLDVIVTATVAADGALSVVSSTPIENPGSLAVSPDGRFLYAAYAAGTGRIQVASIGADGKPVLLPSTTPWESNESERPVFQPPQATPGFTFRPAPPGKATRFDAATSSGASRYDWDFGDGTTLANAGPTPNHAYVKAGVYTVRLSVTNEEGGCASKQLYTGQSTACPGAASITKSFDTLPKIGPLVLSNKIFAVAAGGGAKGKGAATASAKKLKKGTTFHYKLSEPAGMRFTIERRTTGRRVGRRCEPPSPRNRDHRKCSRFRKVGPFNARGRAGKNRTRFSGKVKRRALSPGAYRVTATATDSAGGRSSPRRATFQIIAG